MSYYNTIKIANEMGIPVRQAISKRKSYLLSLIKEEKKTFNEQKDALNACFIWNQIRKMYKEITYLEQFKERDSTYEINDKRIEQANNFPVDSLIEFKNGRCEAFCHESDSYSMSHNIKANRAHCFVCNKSFSPIDILMQRDGLTFIEAVKQLS